jgi:taurine dioxygenase
MAGFHVRELIPAFGAEIEGFDPGSSLNAEECRLLRQVFDDRNVLLFRNLDIDRTLQYRLAEVLLGHELPSDEVAAAGAAAQDGFWISNKEPGAAAPFGRLMFHSDMMWSDEPFQVLSLYGVDVEPPAVPTAFASTTHAWDTLPSSLRARVAGLRAVHVTGPEGFDGRRRGTDDGRLVQPIRDVVLSNTTPVGHRHPRTGRTMLYVSQGMTKEISGLPTEESEDLLEELFEHLYRPAALWQHEWRNGDLIFWDNLAVQHARSDVRTDGPARTLRKVATPIPVAAGKTMVATYQSIG